MTAARSKHVLSSRCNFGTAVEWFNRVFTSVPPQRSRPWLILFPAAV